jgi:hypothetical protein
MCIAEYKKLKDMSYQELLTCKNKKIVLAIYARLIYDRWGGWIKSN